MALALALALGILNVIVAIRTASVTGLASILIALLGGAVSTLIFKGLQKQVEANDIVIRSIFVDAAKAPVLELIDSTCKEVYGEKHQKIIDGWAQFSAGAHAQVDKEGQVGRR